MDSTSPPYWVLPRLEALVQHLLSRFDEVHGPVVEAGVIRIRPIDGTARLPTGIADEQEAASYRLHQTASKRRFGYGPGPDSLKAFVHPPVTPVWTMRRRDGSLIVDLAEPATKRRAVIGVRACDLHALSVLERTQLGGPHPDPTFAARRAGLFLVAVDCAHPAPTCFCDTAGDGPAAERGFDLALTEIEDHHAVSYLVRAGTAAGHEVIAALDLRPAAHHQGHLAQLMAEQCRREFIRELPSGAAEAVRNLEHPRWAEVAERCLTCGDCTTVCPTCFCTDVDDDVADDGETATRTRVWGTCFDPEFTRLGSGVHRASPRARYRQWLTHKLGTWHDQFGESGCTGCGRCITWCPAGIDLTAEVEALERVDAT